MYCAKPLLHLIFLLLGLAHFSHAETTPPGEIGLGSSTVKLCPVQIPVTSVAQCNTYFGPEFARMTGASCGPKSLSMAISITNCKDPRQPSLRNITNLCGWGAGAEMGTPPEGGTVFFPTTFPVPQLEFVARAAGYDLFWPGKHSGGRPGFPNIESSINYIRGMLGSGYPVIVQWQGHLVVVVGFTSKGTFIFHDPQDTSLNPGQMMGYNLEGFGRGSCQEEDPHNWDTPYRFWGFTKWSAFVLMPLKDESGQVTSPKNLDEVGECGEKCFEKMGHRFLGTPGKAGNDKLMGDNEIFGAVAIREYAKLFNCVDNKGSILNSDPECVGGKLSWAHLGRAGRQDVFNFLLTKTCSKFNPATKTFDPPATDSNSAEAELQHALIILSHSIDNWQRIEDLQGQALTDDTAVRKNWSKNWCAQSNYIARELTVISNYERSVGTALLKAAKLTSKCKNCTKVCPAR